MIFTKSDKPAKKKKPKKGPPSKPSAPKVEKIAKAAPAAVITAARAGRPKGPEMTPILLKLPPALVTQVDDEHHRLKLSSRSETIRVLIERGLGGALLEKVGGK